MKCYLFVLCPPFSGSTVLWRLLATSPHVSALPDEGQFLESVEPLMRRRKGKGDRPRDWVLIKQKWEQVWDLSKHVLVEKSPPNLVRAFEIQKHFSPCRFVSMIRNPYAFCEGNHRRRGLGMEYAAGRWLFYAAHQRKNIEGLEHVLHFTYEQFTEDSKSICERILEFLPELERIDSEGTFKARSIHGRGDRPIENLNTLKINQLSAREISRINRVLDEQAPLLEYFGYDLIDPTADRCPYQFRSNASVRATRTVQWLKRLPLRVALGAKLYRRRFFHRTS